jgi:hypothetical protein
VGCFGGDMEGLMASNGTRTATIKRRCMLSVAFGLAVPMSFGGNGDQIIKAGSDIARRVWE